MRPPYFLALRVLLLPFLLLLGTAASAQQDHTIRSVGVVPARFYVGDQVQIYVRVGLAGDADLRPPGVLPSSPGLELREVVCTRIREGEWEVQIHLVSFRPGKFATPPLDLQGIRLGEIEMETRSVLEDQGDEELKPPRRQLVVPGTWFKLGLLAGFLVFFPPVLIFFLKKVPLWWKHYRELRSRNLPSQKMKAVLRRLAKELAKMNGQRFFSELTRAIRIYLTARLSFPADKATTLEIRRILPGRLPAEPFPRDAASGIVTLLERGDHVKFGGKPCGRLEMNNALQKVEHFVDLVEEEENRVES